MTLILSWLNKSSLRAFAFPWFIENVFSAASSKSIPSKTLYPASKKPLESPPQPQNKSIQFSFSDILFHQPFININFIVKDIIESFRKYDTYDYITYVKKFIDKHQLEKGNKETYIESTQKLIQTTINPKEEDKGDLIIKKHYEVIERKTKGKCK